MPVVNSVSTIRILPADVIGRIAAGEVIERPAAVVKELIENSLDAGSSLITIDVERGGTVLIRVTDDGGGIRRADLPLAFERHATSKLNTDDDFMSIRTLGFRGEALPSIASISKVRVTTATKSDTVGSQMILEGGVRQQMTDAPPITGTKIEVSDLFYNQPARKKFLKSIVTEFSHISHVMQQATLAWPSVHFRLTHNGQEILNYPAVTTNRDRIRQVYRPTFVDHVMDLRGRTAGCAITGVMINPAHAGTSRTPQDLFVNQRPVRSVTIFHAVADGYASHLSKGHHPTFVLFLEIDPERIDVNVHPAKREIRFAEQEFIHQFVRQSVRHAIGGPERPLVFGIGAAGDGRAVASLSPVGTVGSVEPDPPSARNKEIPGSPNAVRTPPATSGPDSGNLPATLFVGETTGLYGDSSDAAVIPFGQILRTYLVAQVGQELQIIDQHTAHERVLFQRLSRAWENRQVTSQPLLIPEPIELAASQFALLEHCLADLEQLGLVLEPFGSSAMVLRAVPAGLGQVNGALLVEDLLDDLTQWRGTSSLEARARPILASLACQSAVKAGRPMALPEIARLIRDWVEEGLIMTCPHGRRTAFRLSSEELDKLFGRVGWL